MVTESESNCLDQKIFTLDRVPFNKGEAVLVSGYFDLLHSGHMKFLWECRKTGNPLVVGILAEEVSNKPGRPIMTDDERLITMSGLSCVDHVFLNKYGYSRDIIEAIMPKTVIFSSGEIFSVKKKEQIDSLKRDFPNMEINFIPRQSYTVSTSEIISRILNNFRHDPELTGKIIEKDNIKSELVSYAQRSNAAMKSAALIITEGNMLLSKGVNYHPEISGLVESLNTDTVEYRQSKPRPIHAEIDAILKLIALGIKDTKMLTIHSLNLPCAGCAEIISRLGFKKVVYYDEFDNNYGELILKSNGVQLERR